MRKDQFITRLKLVREHYGLTQKEVALKLNIPYAKYNHYETGRNEPDIDTIIQIADFFNVTSDYLIGREDPYPFKPNSEISQEDKALLQQIKKASADKQKAIELILNIEEKSIASGK